MKAIIFFITLSFAAPSAAVDDFDHSHKQWNALLSDNVTWSSNKTASAVNYANLLKQRDTLKEYLQQISAVNLTDFNAWSKQARLSFLINAYNAFTVDFILTKYPEIKSIKELGSFISSPWSKRLFMLLGKKRSLDDIEHRMIRKKGAFDDPRIHFAVNCASIGCPALQGRAFTPDNVDTLLEDSMTKFLSDKSRNRYNPATGKLEVSKLFKWYTDDFSAGWRGFTSLQHFFVKYAHLLVSSPVDIDKVKGVKIIYLDYDWSLNDKGNL